MGSGKREHGRLVPEDLRSRDRHHRHHLDLDVGAGLVGIDLQEHITDTKCRPLAVGDDNLDLLHVAIMVGTHGGWHPNCGAQTRRIDRCFQNLFARTACVDVWRQSNEGAASQRCDRAASRRSGRPLSRWCDGAALAAV